MVTPVLQKSKKEDPGNYRLVSFSLSPCGAVMLHLFQSHEGDEDHQGQPCLTT